MLAVISYSTFSTLFSDYLLYQKYIVFLSVLWFLRFSTFLNVIILKSWYQNSFQRITSLILSLMNGKITAIQSYVIGSTSQECKYTEYQRILNTFEKKYSHFQKIHSSNNYFWSAIQLPVLFLVLGVPRRTEVLLSVNLYRACGEQLGV